MRQKEAFLNTVSFLMNMDEYRKKSIIRYLFKAVGDRAGPDIFGRQHDDGELLYRHTLKPVGSILRSTITPIKI